MDAVPQAEAAEAVPELSGRLAGEGDRQHPLRVQRAQFRPVRDAVGEHPGLARAGTGQDAQRGGGGGHGLALVVVQAPQEQVRGVLLVLVRQGHGVAGGVRCRTAAVPGVLGVPGGC